MLYAKPLALELHVIYIYSILWINPWPWHQNHVLYHQCNKAPGNHRNSLLHTWFVHLICLRMRGFCMQMFIRKCWCVWFIPCRENEFRWAECAGFDESGLLSLWWSNKLILWLSFHHSGPAQSGAVNPGLGRCVMDGHSLAPSSPPSGWSSQQPGRG